jgi:MFS family permease
LVGFTTRGRLVLAALALWLVGLGAATVIGTAATAMVPVVLFGLGLGLVFPSTFAWVEQFAPADRQGQFSAYVASVGYTGQFVSPLLFGPLVPLVGVRGVFGVAAVAAGLGLVGLGTAQLRG